MLLPIKLAFEDNTAFEQIHVQSFPSRKVLASMFVAVSGSGLLHLSELSRMISKRPLLHVEKLMAGWRTLTFCGHGC